MPPKRRTRARRKMSDPSNVPALSLDLWQHIFSFQLRVHRFQNLCVCRAWREAGWNDPDIWSFLVVTRDSVHTDVAAMSPQRRLPQVYGEYSPSRAVLEGALPIALHRLSCLPNPKFVQEIIFASAWAAPREITDDDDSFSSIQVPLICMHRVCVVAVFADNDLHAPDFLFGVGATRASPGNAEPTQAASAALLPACPSDGCSRNLDAFIACNRVSPCIEQRAPPPLALSRL